jgi:hypothetical protein
MTRIIAECQNFSAKETKMTTKKLALLLALSFIATIAQAKRTFTDDFNDGKDSHWNAVYGEWTVVDGQYVGIGLPSLPQGCSGKGQDSPCGLYSTYIKGLTATDVDMEIDLTAVNGVDRHILLRSDGPCGNAVDLNFRGLWYNDLAIQQNGDNGQIFEIRPGVSQDPWSQPTHVHIRLVGKHLTVWVDGSVVPFVDQDYDFYLTNGRIGLGTQQYEEQHFDNVNISVLQ